MSMRPIDLQLTVQQASEANRLGNQNQARTTMTQQQFAEHMQKRVQESDRQVVEVYKPEGGKVDKDGKGGASSKRRREGGASREKKQSDESAKPLKIPNEASKFDFTV